MLFSGKCLSYFCIKCTKQKVLSYKLHFVILLWILGILFSYLEHFCSSTVTELTPGFLLVHSKFTWSLEVFCAVSLGMFFCFQNFIVTCYQHSSNFFPFIFSIFVLLRSGTPTYYSNYIYIYVHNGHSSSLASTSW